MVLRPHRNQGTSTDATFGDGTLAATGSWLLRSPIAMCGDSPLGMCSAVSGCFSSSSQETRGRLARLFRLVLNRICRVQAFKGQGQAGET